MDSAFKARPWPSLTTAQLESFVATGHEKADAMAAVRRPRFGGSPDTLPGGGTAGA